MNSIKYNYNWQKLVDIFFEQQNNQHITSIFEKKLVELEKLKTQIPNIPNVLIVEKEPENFIASFLAGIITRVNLFFTNPNWQEQEWQQVFQIIQPDLILGQIDFKAVNNQVTTKLNLADSIIAIPTGGTSGKIKFAVHTIDTLYASVAGFVKYFEIDNINSCCVLPLYHVSGLMQFLRSFLTGGKFVSFSYSDLKQNKKPDINPEEFFISLVPTQLQLLLDIAPQWLSEFHTVLLGGAPPWRSLLQQAKQYNISLSLTYGMTETASGIVTLKPQDFLAGNTSNGKVLPHAKVQIVEDTGVIKIFSESLYLGYYPNLSDKNYLITDDLGFFDSKGYLHLSGRNSHKIITGGENVFPSEVESAILATGLVKDVCVIGIEDPKWGQAVTAILVPQDNINSVELIRDGLRSRLSHYKHPKHWIPVELIPRNLQGKINFAKLTTFAENYLVGEAKKVIST